MEIGRGSDAKQKAKAGMMLLIGSHLLSLLWLLSKNLTFLRNELKNVAALLEKLASLRVKIISVLLSRELIREGTR